MKPFVDKKRVTGTYDTRNSSLCIKHRLILLGQTQLLMR